MSIEQTGRDGEGNEGIDIHFGCAPLKLFYDELTTSISYLSAKEKCCTGFSQSLCVGQDKISKLTTVCEKFRRNNKKFTADDVLPFFHCHP